MPGLVDAKGPSYISSHSADVILSDIRPTKLKPDALRAINILLDEFLHKMLSVSGSLATDKLRASLLGLLPTNLGKEALLEAEVELRAYWERTEPRVVQTEDDSRSFHLLWAFELLRLKCEAYSTLNEEDEDPNLEGRVSEKLGKPHPHPPKLGLVDPAALYLTAILEAICEHVLSSVGRVVARDSSRAIATVNDLFVALCEDVSIYGLFKTMKVYQQIEDMSKGTLPRRSKSFTRNDLGLPSRNSSPLGHARVISSSGSRSRQSLVNGNSKVSGERDGGSQLSHNNSESWRSEQLFADDGVSNIAEDAAMLREFDDLMRSTSTLKVSLTPDRLRTMEVYKQQRDINRRPPPPFSFPKQNTPSQKHLVDSIIEDEEENPLQSRARQDSGISRRSSSLAAIIPGRIRSISTSSTSIRGATKNFMRSPSVHPPPSSMSRMIPGKPEMMKIRDVRKPPDIGIPARIHTRQHRRDSLDIDDVMNGSEDDLSQGSISTKQMLSPSSAKRISQYPVSAHTRDLMAFLAEGPPDPKPKLSQSGSELFEFLAQGPPDYPSSPTTVDSKAKNPGRLQRMISKFSIGGEKPKADSDTSSFKQPNSPVRSTISTKPSVTTLSSLANRPIPPRLNTLSQSSYSYDEDKSIRPTNSLRNFHHDIPSPHETTLKPVPVMPSSVPSDTHPLTTYVNGNGNSKNGQSTKEVRSEPLQTPPLSPLSPVRSISRKKVPAIHPPSIPFFTETDAKDMQRLLTRATTADECRLIFSMFMARSGMTEGSVSETDASCRSPSSSLTKNASTPLVHSSIGEALIESTLIEFFLSGTALPDTISRVLSEQNHPDVDIEALVAASETQPNDAKTSDSLSPHSPSISQQLPS